MARTPQRALVPALELIDPMVSSFLGKEKTRQHKALEELILKNFTAGGNEYGFYFRGKRFSLLPAKHLKGAPLNIVEPSVAQEAEDFDAISTKLEQDEKKLTNGLTVVLSRCMSFQDVRDVLPEPLVQVFSQLSTLPRTRDEGWVLQEAPMLRTQYEKTIAIALYYQVNNLIF